MRRGYNEAREVTSRKIAVPEPAGAPRQDWQSPPESGNSGDLPHFLYDNTGFCLDFVTQTGVFRHRRTGEVRPRTLEVKEMPAPLRSATVVLATQVLLFAASPVLGEPLRCQRSIAKESSKFIQSKMKALGKCEDGKVLGRVAANSDCHADSLTALLIARAQAKLQRRLSAHCGGADGICGTGDDDSLASIGWGSITSCPNLENGA